MAIYIGTPRLVGSLCSALTRRYWLPANSLLAATHRVVCNARRDAVQIESPGCRGARLAGGLVCRSHPQQTVGINVKGDLRAIRANVWVGPAFVYVMRNRPLAAVLLTSTPTLLN